MDSAIPIFLFVVDAFVRRTDAKQGEAPFDLICEAYTKASEAKARYAALASAALGQRVAEAPIQRVALYRHQIDGAQPLAPLLASLVTHRLAGGDPPWAVTTKTLSRYQDGNHGDKEK